MHVRATAERGPRVGKPHARSAHPPCPSSLSGSSVRQRRNAMNATSRPPVHRHGPAKRQAVRKRSHETGPRTCTSPEQFRCFKATALVIVSPRTLATRIPVRHRPGGRGKSVSPRLGRRRARQFGVAMPARRQVRLSGSLPSTLHLETRWLHREWSTVRPGGRVPGSATFALQPYRNSPDRHIRGPVVRSFSAGRTDVVSRNVACPVRMCVNIQ